MEGNDARSLDLCFGLHSKPWHSKVDGIVSDTDVDVPWPLDELKRAIEETACVVTGNQAAHLEDAKIALHFLTDEVSSGNAEEAAYFAMHLARSLARYELVARRKEGSAKGGRQSRKLKNESEAVAVAAMVEFIAKGYPPMRASIRAAAKLKADHAISVSPRTIARAYARVRSATESDTSGCCQKSS